VWLPITIGNAAMAAQQRFKTRARGAIDF